MNAPSERHCICGFSWFEGVYPDCVENAESDRHVSISERQWWMLAGLMQKCFADIGSPNPATLHGSWLEGFQMGLRASDAHFAHYQGSPPLTGAGEGGMPEKYGNVAPHGSHSAAAAGSQCAGHQDKTASGSSSDCSDGESAGELSTPPRSDDTPQLGRAPDSTTNKWEREVFERLAMTPVTASKEKMDPRFSNEELLSAIQLVLPDPIILRAGYENVPKTSALYVLRAEMKAVRRQLDTALSLRENRRAAQQRNIFVRLRQGWRLKCLVNDDDGAAGDWEEAATQRLVEICRHSQVLRPQP